MNLSYIKSIFNKKNIIITVGPVEIVIKLVKFFNKKNYKVIN